MNAVRAIKSMTPWMAFQDLVLRRKPSHKQRIDEAFARHTPILAALLAAEVRDAQVSPSLAADIESHLELSRLRDWVASHEALRLLDLLPLPDPLNTAIDLPRNKFLGQLMTYRMVGLGRRVLREHGIEVPD